MLMQVMMPLVIILILDLRSVDGVRSFILCDPERSIHTAETMKYKTGQGETVNPAAGNLTSTTANVRPIPDPKSSTRV